MRMLVIDDEEDICEIIAEIAARHGLDTKTISNHGKCRAASDGFQARISSCWI